MIERIRRYGLAYTFALASAVLASGYGFMSAVGFYAYAKAAILCLVSLGACHGPAWAKDLWHKRSFLGVVIATLATPICLLVTLWGGLGTISSGGAELRAERTKVAGDASRDRASLKRATSELEALPQHRPAETIKAEIKTARASPLFINSEGCVEGSMLGPKTRDHCKAFRVLEGELAAAEKASDLDGQISALNARLAAAPPERDADPQASAFSTLTGLSIQLSLSLYALAASVALELIGMAAMMVAWSEPRLSITGSNPVIAEDLGNSVIPFFDNEFVPLPPPPRAPPPPRPVIEAPARPVPRLVPKPAPVPASGVFGSAKKFVAQRIEQSQGERLAVIALVTQYKNWCKEQGLPAAPVERFLDSIEGLFQIEHQEDGIFALNVRLAA